MDPWSLWEKWCWWIVVSLCLIWGISIFAVRPLTLFALKTFKIWMSSRSFQPKNLLTVIFKTCFYLDNTSNLSYKRVIWSTILKRPFFLWCRNKRIDTVYSKQISAVPEGGFVSLSQPYRASDIISEVIKFRKSIFKIGFFWI